MDATNSLFLVNIASANNSLYSASNTNSSSLLLGASAAIVQTKYNCFLEFGNFWIWKILDLKVLDFKVLDLEVFLSFFLICFETFLG